MSVDMGEPGSGEFMAMIVVLFKVDLVTGSQGVKLGSLKSKSDLTSNSEWTRVQPPSDRSINGKQDIQSEDETQYDGY